MLSCEKGLYSSISFKMRRLSKKTRRRNGSNFLLLFLLTMPNRENQSSLEDTATHSYSKYKPLYRDSTPPPSSPAPPAAIQFQSSHYDSTDELLFCLLSGKSQAITATHAKANGNRRFATDPPAPGVALDKLSSLVSRCCRRPSCLYARVLWSCAFLK